MTETQKQELKAVEGEMAERSAAGKAEIKEKFNQLACKIQIDAQQLVSALIGEEATSKTRDALLKGGADAEAEGDARGAD